MYSVGQILYTLFEKNYKVIPVKIIEEVNVKTLEGETTKYTVQVPSNKEFKKVSLDKLNMIFSSKTEVKKYMLSNATNAIDKVIENAKNIEDAYFYEVKEEKILDSDIIEEQAIEEKNTVSVDLGNGQVGNFNIKNSDILNLGQKKT